MKAASANAEIGTNRADTAPARSLFTPSEATTRTGLLSAPLRDRFQLREHLEFYELPELSEIITRNARKLRIEIEAAAAEKIGHCSRGTPRVANNRLRWVRDYATTRADGRITLKVAEEALAMLSIDSLGLDDQDRRYLETILRVFQGGPVGVEAIAHTLNTATDTLTDEVEPFLLRAELVVRSPRGRKLTATGYQHLGAEPPADLLQSLLRDVAEPADESQPLFD